jgi:hypothetical protein
MPSLSDIGLGKQPLYNNKTELYIFIIICFFVALYFAYIFYIKSSASKTYLKQGGTIILAEPQNINVQDIITTNVELNCGQNVTSYNYCLSFWVYINPNSPTNTIYTNSIDVTYNGSSILSYNNNPAISYNSLNNTFDVYAQMTNKEGTSPAAIQLVYQHHDVQLQKWNHIAFNYVHGTMDIFYNGEIVNSVDGMFPDPQEDWISGTIDGVTTTYKNNELNLTVGQDNGANGKICSVLYFSKSLDYYTIHTLYESLKQSDPPIISNKIDNKCT